MPSITGKVKWASVDKPNTKFEPVWTVDVILDEKLKKKVEAAGLKVKEDKDGDYILKIKRKVTGKKGPIDPPEVTDADGNPFTKLIGNGSECKVYFTIYEWASFGTSGNGAWLNRVEVLNHIPYEDDVDFNSDDDTPTKPDDFDDDIPF